jgi:Tol biopolymer transport system component
MTAPLALMLLAVLLASPPARTQQAFEVQRVSVASDGSDAHGYSSWPDLSRDGRMVAFRSVAPNLAAGDVNDLLDVFVHDRLTGQTTCVSVDEHGVPRGGELPAISADGRFVAFLSATLGAAGSPPDVRQVFVRDLVNGFTQLASVSSQGEPGDADSDRPSLSADGRLVAFSGASTNLAPPPAESADTISTWLRDTWLGTTVNILSIPEFGDGIPTFTTFVMAEHLSADGTRIAILDGYDCPKFGGAVWGYVRDLVTGTTFHPDATSLPGCGSAYGMTQANLRLSADGRVVAFLDPTISTQCGPGSHAFTLDLESGRLAVVSATLKPGHLASAAKLSISPDGGHAAFVSTDTGIVAGDGNTTIDTFVRDIAADTTTLVSVTWTGQQAEPDPFPLVPYTSISDRALQVAWVTAAPNVVPDDDNGAVDVFIHDRDAWFTLGSALPGVAGPPRLAAQGLLGPGGSGLLLLSRAAPGAPALLFIAASEGAAPFKGGTLLAAPFVVVLPLATDASGQVELTYHVPTLPPGFEVYVQAAIEDLAAVKGVALSNAMRGAAP